MDDRKAIHEGKEMYVSQVVLDQSSKVINSLSEKLMKKVTAKQDD